MSRRDSWPICSIDGCERLVRCRKMCSLHYNRWRRDLDMDAPPIQRKQRSQDTRFFKLTKWGEPSEHRPDLGPCLLWMGSDNGNGYGQFQYDGHNGYAHRYAWERVHGPIPEGQTVDHLCRVRRCVNDAHFELTDGVDNYLRGVATREKCPQGHEYTPDNLYFKRSRPGIRLCLRCKMATTKRGGLRRTNAAKGIPDGRTKFDHDKRDRLVIDVVEQRKTVALAAEELGCAYKYMDKLVAREAKQRGVLKRRGHKKPILFDGWTECKTRIAVRQRSNEVCERCDQARATDMHHRKNRSQSGRWHPANIMHICALCHVEITAEPELARENGWSMLSTHNPADVPVLRRGIWCLLDNVGGWREVKEPAE